MNRHERGRLAEEIVVAHLEAAGFEIAARNLRLGALELDIVARKGKLCVVCEVRSLRRKAWIHPSETITPEKRERIRRAALLMLRTEAYRGCRLRLDVATIEFVPPHEPILTYYEAAL